MVAEALGKLRPLQRVLRSRKVGLCRKGEQVRLAAIRAGQILLQIPGPQLPIQWDVAHLRVVRARELTQPVNGVVVVGDQQEPRACTEGIAFPHQLQGAARVQCKDHLVLCRIGPEEVQHPAPGVLHLLRARLRGRIS